MHHGKEEHRDLPAPDEGKAQQVDTPVYGGVGNPMRQWIMPRKPTATKKGKPGKRTQIKKKHYEMPPPRTLVMMHPDPSQYPDPSGLQRRLERLRTEYEELSRRYTTPRVVWAWFDSSRQNRESEQDVLWFLQCLFQNGRVAQFHSDGRSYWCALVDGPAEACALFERLAFPTFELVAYCAHTPLLHKAVCALLPTNLLRGWSESQGDPMYMYWLTTVAHISRHRPDVLLALERWKPGPWDQPEGSWDPIEKNDDGTWRRAWVPPKIRQRPKDLFADGAFSIRRSTLADTFYLDEVHTRKLVCDRSSSLPHEYGGRPIHAQGFVHDVWRVSVAALDVLLKTFAATSPDENSPNTDMNQQVMTEGQKRVWDALAGRALTGKELASPDELDTSEEVVRQYVRGLRQAGYKVKTRPGRGYYRPGAPPDDSAPPANSPEAT